MHTEQIVVVGAGPAGCAAAVQCKRLGETPLLLDRTGRAGGLLANACSIENYPGLKPLPGPIFAEKLAAHLARFELPIARGEVTTLVPTEEGLVIRGDFGEVQARCVILAIGTNPLALGIPGAAELTGSGMFYEVSTLLAAVDAPRRVLVIGGSEAALDYALSLAGAGARVTILVRGPALRAGRGRLVSLVRRNPMIELVLETIPRRVGREGRGIVLETAGTQGRTRERADALLAAIGRWSAAEALLNRLNIDPQGPIRTSRPGLFVAGDARLGSLGQIGMAVGDGLAAATAAVTALEG